MIHALLAQKELEVTRSELWTVVGDDSRIYTGVPLACPLQNDLDISLLHALT